MLVLDPSRRLRGCASDLPVDKGALLGVLAHAHQGLEEEHEEMESELSGRALEEYHALYDTVMSLLTKLDAFIGKDGEAAARCSA